MNTSSVLINLTDDALMQNRSCLQPPSYQDHYLVQIILSLLYSLVFIIAVSGNTLVVYVVASNKDMQSVTNIFITNLAVSDILVNFTSLWLTPCYIFLGRWVWGSAMCHAMPMFQGMSTFISAFTLTAIAIDRYMVILHPFRPRMSLRCCLFSISGIWISGFVLVTPLASHMDLYYPCGTYICSEDWSWYPNLRIAYGFVVMSLQFGIPFLVIACCYIQIWIRVMYRKSMLTETKSSQSITSEDQRKRRLLKMMICMVVIFGLCWLPVNALNVLRDTASAFLDMEEYFVILFLCAHLCSMSATCWNPILYAWMNENFRREFKAVLPCFNQNERIRRSSSYLKAHRRSTATAIDQNTVLDTFANRSPRGGSLAFLLQRRSDAALIDAPYPRIERNRFNSGPPITCAAIDEKEDSFIDRLKFMKSRKAVDRQTTCTALLSPPDRNQANSIVTADQASRNNDHVKIHDDTNMNGIT